ncbi:rhomboid family intramembrane serine protease [Georgenia sp. MJ170]|uniref:rhomboid family intramembrane serine protease n=1 Tax=Georgenia sunbinii TaxID=3117728 RepID=UPI002F267DEF
MESLLLGIIITTIVVGTVLYLRGTDGRFRLPTATLAMAAVTLVVSIVGNLNPDVLELLGRDRSLLQSGQWWRLVAPLFVQDGGWAGTIFNITSLIAIGLCAESLHRSATFLVTYSAAGLVSEVFGYTLMQHQGFAGNSVANMGAAGLCLVGLCAARILPARIVAIIGVLAGIVLIVNANLHGVGFAVGALIGLAVVWTRSATAAPSDP